MPKRSSHYRLHTSSNKYKTAQTIVLWLEQQEFKMKCAVWYSFLSTTCLVVLPELQRFSINFKSHRLPLNTDALTHYYRWSKTYCCCRHLKYKCFSILKGVPEQQFCDLLVSFFTFLISLYGIKKQKFPEELVSFSSSCLWRWFLFDAEKPKLSGFYTSISGWELGLISRRNL